MHTHTHTHTHKCALTYTHTHTKSTCGHTHKNVCSHTHIHPYKYNMHAHAHTLVLHIFSPHTQTMTHTPTHTSPQASWMIAHTYLRCGSLMFVRWHQFPCISFLFTSEFQIEEVYISFAYFEISEMLFAFQYRACYSNKKTCIYCTRVCVQQCCFSYWKLKTKMHFSKACFVLVIRTKKLN